VSTSCCTTDAFSLEVDVVPAEAKCLASPEAGESDQMKERVDAVVANRVEKLAQLGTGPDRCAGLVGAWKLDVKCRVPGDEVTLHG
jgi:hypothetical protein